MQALRHVNVAKGLAPLAVALWCAASVSASATTFAFDQTSSTVPGFVVNASISINGTLADLPTIGNLASPGPYDFSPLSAFDITLPSDIGEGHYTLADFTARASHGPDYPQWSISPSGIDFINVTDSTDFKITGFGPASMIEFESDGPTTPGDCTLTGHCIATGHWDPVAAPEPASAALLLTGLLGGALTLRKRMPSARPAGI